MRREANYFYIVRRVGKRVERVYVGRKSDPVVAILHREDRLRKADKQAYRRQRAAERDWYQQIDELMEQRRRQLREAQDLWLITQGRRVSGRKRKSTRTRRLKGKPVPASMTQDDFDVLVKLAEQGDARARTSLCDLMQSDRETFRPFGDLAGHIQHQFLDMLTRGSVVARESMKANLVEMKQQLRGGVESPIRDLAVDQVVLTWLDMHYNALMTAEPRDGKTEVEFLERRLARSERRYRDALEFFGRIDESLGSAQNAAR